MPSTAGANMTVVVQPNIVTRDHKAGVQAGELIRVTRTGFERCMLHCAASSAFSNPDIDTARRQF